MTERNKFLATVERTAILLGHKLDPWTKDNFGFHTKCVNCGATINAKVGLKLTSLTDEMCKGKPE